MKNAHENIQHGIGLLLKYDGLAGFLSVQAESISLSRPFTALPKWNFGTREGKNKRQGRNSMKFGTNDSKWWNSKELKFQTQSADSNLRPPLEDSGTSKDLPTLGPRVEGRNETRNPPCGGRGGWMEGILRL
ncbi:hypothetical protein AVEN_156844-1 [Araneus ventricosus]|uniref:Uncharacterized protein n=1 Tax=Araneus ventricosus TaxID=182803 RepID=A0A4Y2X002_ARAVE|nr:hypothetical protein AVEN_156844-1 [Araneus ventricosus]